MERWFLEGFFGSEKVLSQLPLTAFPFKIGRQQGLDLTLHRPDISRLHAEFDQSPNGIVLRDFSSTNGTYVNQERVAGEVTLKHGDVVQFANFAVRLVLSLASAAEAAHTLETDAVSDNVIGGDWRLQELLDDRAVTALFQPIVEAGRSGVFGYEVLGRGVHTMLPRDPGPLFRMAENIGKAVELSELFRQQALYTASSFPSRHKYFINIHPSELSSTSRLLFTMERLRRRYPQLRLVLEINEHAVSDIEDLKRLGGELRQMDVELAYDDFGAGQARLLELVEVPASYLKFDISLIHDIDHAGGPRREMISILLELAKRMNIATLAEGLDRKGEADVCRELGFDYLQGYYFGYPAPEPLAA